MPAFRPEAIAQLLRWREVLVGAASFLLGAWWLTGPGGLLTIPAAAMLIAGAALVWIGLQRARFRTEGDGPGSVEVDEGAVTYFGPLTGGTAALREIGRITFDPGLHPPHWRLWQPGASELLIPVNAVGAEALFDAFATLPDFPMEKALTALRTRRETPIVIWTRVVSISELSPLH